MKDVASFCSASSQELKVGSGKMLCLTCTCDHIPNRSRILIGSGFYRSQLTSSGGGRQLFLAKQLATAVSSTPQNTDMTAKRNQTPTVSAGCVQKLTLILQPYLLNEASAGSCLSDMQRADCCCCYATLTVLADR